MEKKIQLSGTKPIFGKYQVKSLVRMEVITSLGYITTIPGRTEDVTYMQRKLIYTEIWHCLSVIFFALIAVVILMLLVTFCIFAIKWSWFLIWSMKWPVFRAYEYYESSAEQENNSPTNVDLESSIFEEENKSVTNLEPKSFESEESKSLMDFDNELEFEKIENVKSSQKGKELTFQNKETHFSSKHILMPSSVSADNLPVLNLYDTFDSGIFSMIDSGISSMYDYGYSSNHSPVVQEENKDNSNCYKHMENICLNPENKKSLNDHTEENISLSLKCKPEQESQICNGINESRNFDNSVPNRECEQDGNCYSNENCIEECTERSISPSKKEGDSETADVNSMAENKFLSPLSMSTERLDSRVTLDDEHAQQHLLSLLDFDSDDEETTVIDSDETDPKVPYNQEEQFQGRETLLENYRDSFNYLNKNRRNDFNLQNAEVCNDFSKYTVKSNSNLNQSGAMKCPVYSFKSSSYGHQVESVSNIKKAQCCINPESTRFGNSEKNADLTSSFHLYSQHDCNNTCLSCLQPTHHELISHYKELHLRENVADKKKEMKSICKHAKYSFPPNIMSSFCRHNNYSIMQDMISGCSQLESFITLENRNEGENEHPSVALKNIVSQKRQENLKVDEKLSENNILKVFKQKFKFSGKGSNSKDKHGRKVSPTNAEKRRYMYSILMNHCKRFFRRMNRYKRKRRIREVISSRYVNIYDCNERSDVFPFYNNGNHNPSDLHGGVQNGYATAESAEVAMERVRNRHTTLETRAVNSISDSLSSYFQRMSEQQPMSTVEKMQFEWLRLQSFSTFPSSSGVSPILLAKWGYFATGVGDETMTFCCEQRHRNWQFGDDPQAIHRQQSPSCSFILGIGHSNVPVHDIRPRRNLPDSVQESTSQTGSNQIPNGVLPNSQSASALPNQAGPVTSTPDSAAVVARSASSQQRNEHTARATQSANQSGAVNGTALPGAAYHAPENRSNGSGVDSTHRGSATQSRNDTLGIYFEKPRYPNYAVLAIRVSSFGGWPSYLSQTPREMSLAGFFYAGYGDYVRCFFCGGGLRNWDSGDDPWVEHARWFPKCAFVRQNRGEAFVDLVLKRHAELQAQSQQNQANQQPQQTVDNTQQNSTDDMSTPAALSIIEMGFSEDTVRAAILEFKRRKPQGRQTFTAPELLEIVLNEQQSQVENAANSGQQQNASVEPQTPSGPSEQSTLHTRQQPEASATTQQQASAATPKTKDQKSKSEKKKKKKEQAAEKQKPKEQEKAIQKTTEQKKSEDAQSQVKGQGVQAEAEATNDRFSSMRVSDSLDQMTLEEVRSLQEENAQLREQTICKICMDKNVSVAFLPCGHLACCDDCAPAMRTCPICRQLVKGTVKTYLV